MTKKKTQRISFNMAKLTSLTPRELHASCAWSSAIKDLTERSTEIRAKGDDVKRSPNGYRR